MPIFSYVCKDCGEKFDLLVGVTAETQEVKCKKCDSKNIQRTLTSFGVNVSSGGGSSGASCPTGTCPTGF